MQLGVAVIDHCAGVAVQRSGRAIANLQTVCAVHLQPLHPHAAKGVHQLHGVILLSAPHQLLQQAWDLLLGVVHDIAHIQQAVIQHCKGTASLLL